MTDKIDLSGSWKRQIGVRQIDFVTVPGAFAPLGECVLEREFACDLSLRDGERLFLVTEGVLATAAFTLNGHKLGTAGPWATYRFELPAGLLKARNTITAHIRDLVEPFGPTPGRRFDAGLVRPIWIERRPASFLQSFSFSAVLSSDLSSADCTVAVEVDGPSTKPVDLVLQECITGREIAHATATPGQPARFRVDHPLHWSPERPNLYTLTATLPGDQAISEQIGFRRIEVRHRDFYLNNNRLLLKGVCRHEFTHVSGYSPTEDEVRRELAMIRHAGFNYIRLVHSPQAACVCRIAAELGIFVSEEPGTCFHDLADPAIYGPAFEAMRRTVYRDRNVPSILAWLIYNECRPNSDYAVMAAKVCREMNPGCLVAMADCSGENAAIKAMVKAADLSFYGINVYSYSPNDYRKRMETFDDKPLVFTEWGGVFGQGNARLLKSLCDGFVLHAQQQRKLRIAGCSFWAWADYEEHSRPGPAAIDGWTIEGLVDADGSPKPDLQQLSMMCFEMGREPIRVEPKVEVLSQRPRRDGVWQPVDLMAVSGDQVALEAAVDEMRSKHYQSSPWEVVIEPSFPILPRFGQLLVDGIEMRCRDTTSPASPLLIGKSRGEVVIPINARVRSIAVLGHVALLGGYPSNVVQSVHHRDAETSKALGEAAAEYELVFADGTEVKPLRHGIEILRANDICRWWTPAPRAPETRPAVRCVVDKSFEILRLDLWELTLPAARQLQSMRWRLTDPDAILAMYALSVQIDE